VGVRERGDQFRRLVRSAIADLFDQRRPFGRLALTHVMMTAGDTLFAVSLAGSLFFSISPTEAKDKVLLYLLLTIGPFAVVAPALGPVVDRSRGARRATVVASALGRAALCPVIARDIHSLLLFPEAFARLVLSKVYLVTKGALVPEMAAMGLLDEEIGSAADPTDPTDPAGGRPASPVSGPDPTPPYGTPVVHVDDVVTGADRVEPDLATLNARLGLLASLSGFAFALPAVALLKLGGAPWVLWGATGVFAAAVVCGARLPVPHRLLRGRARGGPDSGSPDRGRVDVLALPPGVDAPFGAADADDLAAFRPIADTAVLRALVPMSVLKGLVGFMTFLVAFGFRREGAATWWFGLVLGGLTAGALLGVLLVGRIRRVLSEQQILIGSLWLVGVVAALGAVYPSRWFEAVVALGIGAAGAMSKPSFDALVQRHVRESDQGRAFARFETQLQLMWVVGSLVPVVLSLPIDAGNLVMAAVAVVAGVSTLQAERGARRPAGA
jgi:hypothetical protein